MICLTKIISEEAGRVDAPISAITVAAPMAPGPAVLAISWADYGPEAATGEMPPGVIASIMTRRSDSVIEIPQIEDLEHHVVRSAWSLGAWDISRTCLPGGSGGLNPSLAAISAAAMIHGHVVWTYRPMLRAPEIRIKAWAAKDHSLVPVMLGREGEPPPISLTAIRSGRRHVIRLGTPPQGDASPATSPEPYQPRATRKQRWAIILARRDLGESGAALPARLTSAEASVIITDLRARLAQRGSLNG